MSNSTPRTRPSPSPARVSRRRVRSGFTLIEILIVIVIIAMLAALLLPAINGAIVKAREAAVNSEVNLLAQAMASFKSKYGDYPPSRVLLVENGNYTTYMTTNTAAGPIGADISVAQLAQRSIAALRKFWPRVSISTNGTNPLIPNGSGALTGWYDFNGNGTLDATPYILDGRECLTFFLGGVPTYTAAGFAGGMSGFARNPQNPFMNNISATATTPASPMFSNNRSAPFFEFAGNRLQFLPEELNNTKTPTGMPGYGDTNSSALVPNFYAYFSAYGTSNYDPNDVNAYDSGNLSAFENDVNGNAISLNFLVNFPVLTGPPNVTSSPAPNPYTNSITTTAVSYWNPNSFQIISPGADAHYGTGGQYTPDAGVALPVNGNDRSYEQDNLSNFHNGRFQ
jgi:general secretion pathway protein G